MAMAISYNCLFHLIPMGLYILYIPFLWGFLSTYNITIEDNNWLNIPISGYEYPVLLVITGIILGHHHLPHRLSMGPVASLFRLWRPRRRARPTARMPRRAARAPSSRPPSRARLPMTDRGTWRKRLEVVKDQAVHRRMWELPFGKLT